MRWLRAAGWRGGGGTHAVGPRHKTTGSGSMAGSATPPAPCRSQAGQVPLQQQSSCTAHKRSPTVMLVGWRSEK